MGRPGLPEACLHLQRELESNPAISTVSLLPSVHSVKTIATTNRKQQLWSLLVAQDILFISCFLDSLDSGKKGGGVGSIPAGWPWER